MATSFFNALPSVLFTATTSTSTSHKHNFTTKFAVVTLTVALLCLPHSQGVVAVDNGDGNHRSLMLQRESSSFETDIIEDRFYSLDVGGYHEEETVLSADYLDGIRHDDGNNGSGDEEEFWLNDHDIDDILASLNTKNSDGDLEENVDMVLERKFKQQQQQRAEKDESLWQQQQQQWSPTLKGGVAMEGDRNLRAKNERKKKKKKKKQQKGATRNSKKSKKKTNRKRGKKEGDKGGNGITRNESKRIKNGNNNNNKTNKNKQGQEQGDYHQESEKIMITDSIKPKNVRLPSPDRYRTCFACNRNKHFDLPPLEKDECGRTKYTIRRDAYNFGAQLYKDKKKIPKGVPRPYTCPCTLEGESRVEGEFQVTFFNTTGNPLTLDDKIGVEETTLRFLSDNLGSDDTFRAVCAYVGDSATVSGRAFNTSTVRFSIIYIVKDDYQMKLGLMEKNGRSGSVRNNGGGGGGGEGSRGLQSVAGGCTVDQQISCCTQITINEGIDVGLGLTDRCVTFGCALPGTRAGKRKCGSGNRRKLNRNLPLRSQPLTLPSTPSNKGDADPNRRLQEEQTQCGSSNGLEDVPFNEAIEQGASYKSEGVLALPFTNETEDSVTVGQCSENWFLVNVRNESATKTCDDFNDECDAIEDLSFDVPESRCLAPSSMPSASPSTDAPTTASPSTDAPTTASPSTNAPTTASPSTDVPTTAIPTVSACSDFNLCIAIDMSGSVCNGRSSLTCEGCQPAQFCNSGGETQSICCPNFANTLETTKGLITALGEGASADQDYSIVYYSNSASEASRLNSWTQAVETLNKLEYTGGGSNMAEAISLCQSTLDESPPGRKNYMLIFLDGVPTRPDPSTAESAARDAASNAKEQGSIIIPFLRQEGSESDEVLLSYLKDDISSAEKVFVTGSKGLNNLKNSLEEEGICLQSEGSIFG